VVASAGVLKAARFEPDGRVAEHKSPGLHVANPALTRMAQWFCAAITRVFSSMAYAGDDYISAVHGDRFLIAERAKLGSLDDLNHLLQAGQS
jgi:roadblock/LC7 domain-containing protein